VDELSVREARRLALARAGLLKSAWSALPRRAAGRGKRARDAANAVVRHFGYLQLDTVSIAGARSHAIVLMSRLEGIDPALGEELLRPGEPLFEYWGHEASWIPLELYPAFGFRRREFRHHPWWGDVLKQYPRVARRLRRRIREEGPLRSIEMEGRNFQRSYDLAERIIPEALRGQSLSKSAAIEVLLLKALEGHGWATSGTLAATWRLSNEKRAIDAALGRLLARGEIVRCALENPGGRPTPGWIRPRDRELAAQLDNLRPRRDRGVLLSPFDPLLWDRARVKRLFGFDQVLEIFKPAPKRTYGYYCLPVLAGERLVARFDFKAQQKEGALEVLSSRFEATGSDRPATAVDGEAARSAAGRYAGALGLRLSGLRC